MRVWIYGSLGLGLVLAGCTDAPHANQDADAAVVRDGGVQRDSAVATTQCEEIGTWNSSGLTGKFGPYQTTMFYNTLWVKFGNPATNAIGIEGYGTSQLQGVEADLSTTTNANYATCQHCVIVYRNCTFSATGTTCADGPYFQRAGNARFGNFATTTGGNFGGVFTDVTLERVNIDESTAVSTPVPGGSCLHLTSVNLAGTVGTASSSSGAAGTTESSASASAGGETYYNTCSTNTDCTGTPKCLAVTGKTGKVCSKVCTTDADCPSSGLCIKFGTIGNCLPPCSGGTCNAPLTCHNYTKLATSTTAAVCAPSDW